MMRVRESEQRACGHGVCSAQPKKNVVVAGKDRNGWDRSVPLLTLVADGRLEVDVYGPGDVSAGAGLGEEGGEGVVGHPGGLLVGYAHGPVGLDPVLQTVQLPALVSGLDPGLSEVDRDAL